MIVDMTNAIKALRPGAQFVLRNEEYLGLEWHDELQTPPTEEEVMGQIAKMHAQYDAAQYQRNRERTYPTIADQLDTLYHGGYDAWRAQIEAVKTQFPKPEESA